MSRFQTSFTEPFGVKIEFDDGIARFEDIMALGPEEKTELVGLYQWNGLLLLRGLALDFEQQSQLCGLFGPISAPDHPIISNVRPDGILGNYELRFHHDIPYVPVPYLGGALYALEVDDAVNATRFASGYLAYERLSERLKQRVEGLNALHVRGRAQGRRSRLTDLLPGDICAVHSIVGHHGVTQRPYLFVDEDMTSGVIGLTEDESEDLLYELFSCLYSDDAVYEHPWRAGDLVIWDNRAVQHARHALTTPATRTLRRVNIATLSYFEQCPSDLGARENLLNSRGGNGWATDPAPQPAER
jgi:taurine dioxygenase